VAQDFQRVGIVLLDQLEARVGGERRGEIDEARSGSVFSRVHCGLVGLAVRLAVDGDFDGSGDGSNARRDGGCSEARRDRVGNLKRRCAGGHFANGPVGQVYGDHVRAHVFGGFRCGRGMKNEAANF